MKEVNIAVIGAGNIGSMHIDYLDQGRVTNCQLYTICDINPKKLEIMQEKYGDKYLYEEKVETIFLDEKVDAVLIATPHYDHPVLAIEALKSGKHVLIEKPAGVYTQKVKEMNQVAEKHPELSLGIMYNQRTNPLYQKAKELVETKAIGELRRTNWIITTWYRSQSYYNSGGWRATWRGEGGGVLLNQDPHQLDLWQWICGMPNKVHSFTYFGKRRDIEVEDEVTAFVEYPNKATGVFITSVSETPGTNRFEIVGTKGKLVIENEKISFWQPIVDEKEFNQTYQGGFGEPEIWEIDIPVKFDNTDEHLKITQNFINHICHGEALLASGTDGIKGLEISNAIHLSAWTNEAVNLPINDQLFKERLDEKIEHSQVKDVE